MEFRFVHTADWQLGKPFGGFPDDLRPLLAQARLDAIDRLAEAARAAGTRHVLVAGDVFDAADVPRKVIAGPVERMRRHDGLVWHLLPGNHDPHAAGGLWERLAPNLAVNIRPHLEPQPVEIEGGVWLLPAPLTRRAQAEDPTGWMDAASTPEGALRIGLAHGSVQGFGSLGEAAVPISPARAESAGLGYLALGDWHGTKRIAERVWYSGTPEPDQFADNGAGQALVVTARAGRAAPVVVSVATARYRWIVRDAEISAPADAKRIIDGIADELGKPQDVLLRLVLRGRVAIAAHAELAGLIEEARAVFAYLEADDRALESLVGDGAESAFAEDDVLAAVVARLSRQAEGAGSGPAVGRQALRLVGQLVAEERGGMRR